MGYPPQITNMNYKPENIEDKGPITEIISEEGSIIMDDTSFETDSDMQYQDDGGIQKTR